jgi:cytoskeletal protein RodZ
MEIGSTLREARVSQDIDVADVESFTKIRAKFLRSLENEEWGMVGDDTLVKSFLRTYAEYLKLDPRPLVEEFALRRHSDEAYSAPIAPLGSRRPSEPAGSNTPAARIALGLSLLAVAALLIWLGGSN